MPRYLGNIPFLFVMDIDGTSVSSARRKFLAKAGARSLARVRRIRGTFSDAAGTSSEAFYALKHYDLPAFRPYEFGDMMPEVTVAIVDNIKDRSCLKAKKKQLYEISQQKKNTVTACLNQHKTTGILKKEMKSSPGDARLVTETFRVR